MGPEEKEYVRGGVEMTGRGDLGHTKIGSDRSSTCVGPVKSGYSLIKDLGILVDCGLKFVDHIHNIGSRASRNAHLVFLPAMRLFLPKHSLYVYIATYNECFGKNSGMCEEIAQCLLCQKLTDSRDNGIQR